MIAHSILEETTPVILTYNEAANIGRVLGTLGWAKHIVVVDSGSTDGTLEILARDPRIKVFYRAFDAHYSQWLFAMSQTGIDTKWVLRLDADYLVPPEFGAELAAIDVMTQNSAYRAGFDYAVLSRKLRASLYPPKPLLLRMGKFNITDLGHTEGWDIIGPVSTFRSRLIHDDWKSMDSWVVAQARYMRCELMKIEAGHHGLRDWLRLHPPLMPIIVPIYCLFAKGLILDGRAGLHYTFQRTIAEAILALMVIDDRLRRISRPRN